MVMIIFGSNINFTKPEMPGMKQVRSFLSFPTIPLIMAYVFLGTNLSAQPAFIHDLEARIKNGDKSALYEIARYLDSNRKYSCLVGCQMATIPIKGFAEAAIERTFLLTENEPDINDLTAQDFTEFLKFNKSDISYDTLAGAFLRTPLADRDVYFKATEISIVRKKYLEKKKAELLNLDWVAAYKIDSFYRIHSSAALLQMSSCFYKYNYDFELYIDDEAFADLVTIFTGIDLATGIDPDNLFKTNPYYQSPSHELNFLIYFSKYYKNFKWDSAKGIFINPDLKISPIDPIRLKFEFMFCDVDSLSDKAYMELTETDPEKLKTYYSEYTLSYNKDYKFLYPLSLFTQYCSANNFDYKGSPELQRTIKALDNKMPFAQRYKIENDLIKTFSYDKINALEYWTLLSGSNGYLPYSAARILDIYYSHNWNVIINDPERLKLFLKKAYIFDNLDIVGVCNNYLRKFSNTNLSELAKIQALTTTDIDIKEQIAGIGSMVTLKQPVVTPKHAENKEVYFVKDLEKKLHALLPYFDKKKSFSDCGVIYQVVSKIGYDQIGVAIKKLEEFDKVRDSDKYKFIETDWGFIDLDLTDETNRREFLDQYSKLSQFGLYAFYLDKAGIDYKDSACNLDYDKIYEHLKYDRITPFIGGGITLQDEVYSLIKLLEITFSRNLGFKTKLCDSGGFHYCELLDQSYAWLHFLEDNKLLKQKHDDPPSFSRE